jgi:hypothetical protein
MSFKIKALKGQSVGALFLPGGYTVLMLGRSAVEASFFLAFFVSFLFTQLIIFNGVHEFSACGGSVVAMTKMKNYPKMRLLIAM